MAKKRKREERVEHIEPSLIGERLLTLRCRGGFAVEIARRRGGILEAKKLRREDPLVTVEKQWMAGRGRVENLRPWKPGQSGNPSGRPRKRPISDRYAELVEDLLPEKDRIKRGLPKGATYGDAVALSVVESALKGRTDAAREIREAIEGKAGQRMEISEPEKKDVQIHVVYDKPKGRAPDNRLIGPAQDADR